MRKTTASLITAIAATCTAPSHAAVTDMDANDNINFNVYASVNVSAITAWNGGSAGPQNFTPARVAYDGSSNLYLGVWDNDWSTSNPSSIIKVSNVLSNPVASLTNMKYKLNPGTPLTGLDYNNGSLIASYCSNPYAFNKPDSYVISYNTANESTNWKYVGDGNNVGHQPTSGAAFNPATGKTTFYSMGYTAYEIDNAGSVKITTTPSMTNPNRPVGILALDFDKHGNAAYIDFSLKQKKGAVSYSAYNAKTNKYTSTTAFTFTGNDTLYNSRGYDIALITLENQAPLFAISLAAGTTATTNTGVTLNDSAVFILDNQGKLVAKAAQGWANVHGVDFVNNTLVVTNAHSETIEFISVSVPEPASFALLSLASLPLLIRRNRRSH